MTLEILGSSTIYSLYRRKLFGITKFAHIPHSVKAGYQVTRTVTIEWIIKVFNTQADEGDGQTQMEGHSAHRNYNPIIKSPTYISKITC
jgi:hypothetical protein